MPIVFRSPRAERDLIEIWCFIAEDSESAADRLLDSISQALNTLAESPELGRARDELVEGIRSFPVGNYLLFYRSRPNGVELVRVLHGARDLGSHLG